MASELVGTGFYILIALDLRGIELSRLKLSIFSSPDGDQQRRRRQEEAEKVEFLERELEKFKMENADLSKNYDTIA